MPTASTTRTAVLLAALMVPGSPLDAHAAPPTPTAADPAKFEAGFQAGQDQYDAGDPLGAARTWRDASRHLPETPEHQANRAGLHVYIADAYTKALQAGSDPAVLREAIAALDDYAAQFSAAHPEQTISADIESARTDLRARQHALDAIARPEPVTPPPPPPQPTARPIRALQIVGGVSIGVGAALAMALFPASMVRKNNYRDQFNDIGRGCDPNDLTAECGQIKQDWFGARNTAVAAAVLAPVFLSAGIAMVVVGAKRKRAERSLLPAVGPTTVGLTWHGRF